MKIEKSKGSYLEKWKATKIADGVTRLSVGDVDRVAEWTRIPIPQFSKTQSKTQSPEIVGGLEFKFAEDKRTFRVLNWGKQVFSVVGPPIVWRERPAKYLGDSTKKPYSKYEGLSIRAEMPPNILHFGLGEKTGPLQRNERLWSFWNANRFAYGPSTDPLTKTIPFILCASPEREGIQYFGIYVEMPGRGFIDLRGKRRSNIEIKNCDKYLSIYFIAGPTPAKVLDRFTAMSGRTPVPPLWTLGYHHSRMDLQSELQVNQFVKKFSENDLPLESVHLDLCYMDSFKLFTFDKKRFPSGSAFFRQLIRKGIKPVLILNPGVKKDTNYSVYETGHKKDVFIRRKDGSEFEGELWPGACCFPDYMKPKTRMWWRGYIQQLLSLGARGIWLDMNEPSLLSGKESLNGTVHHPGCGPVDHDLVHNLYGNYMAEATISAFTNPKDAFVLARGAYTGIQKSAAVWIGDNCSSFEHLNMSISTILGLGLSGVGFCGGDLGGFVNDVYPELLARWYQFGSITPFFRNHSMEQTRSQEPWNFPKEIQRICRKYMKLRYELLPYFVDTFQTCAENGLPILRPMFLEFPNDRTSLNLSDQFMLGSEILVSPVTKAGVSVREVWLPEGIWFEYWTGKSVLGGRHILAEAPLDTMPMYIREGAVIPRWYAGLNTDTTKKNVLRLDVYVSKNKIKRSLVADPKYFGLKGAKTILVLEYSGDEKSLSIRINSSGEKSCIDRVDLTLHGFSNTMVHFKHGSKIQVKLVVAGPDGEKVPVTG